MKYLGVALNRKWLPASAYEPLYKKLGVGLQGGRQRLFLLQAKLRRLNRCFNLCLCWQADGSWHWLSSNL